VPLHVTSEIGRLETVLLHTPGPELKAVTPTNRADYLYDDIIAVEIAQREHRRFVSVLQRFAEVWQVSDLLAEVLEQGEAREFLTTRTLAVVPSEPLARRLASLPPREIVRLLIEGEQEEAGPLAKALNSDADIYGGSAQGNMGGLEAAPTPSGGEVRAWLPVFA